MSPHSINSPLLIPRVPFQLIVSGAEGSVLAISINGTSISQSYQTVSVRDPWQGEVRERGGGGGGNQTMGMREGLLKRRGESQREGVLT